YGEYIGTKLRKSDCTSFFLSSISAVRKLFPRGLNGKNPKPSSSRVGSSSSSERLHHSEYSLCTAVSGCTACARRIVRTPASHMPKCFTLPCAINSLKALATH